MMALGKPCEHASWFNLLIWHMLRPPDTSSLHLHPMLLLKIVPRCIGRGQLAACSLVC